MDDTSIDSFSKIEGTVFKNTCNILLIGAPFSGKTYFAKKLLFHRDVLFTNPPDKIIYFYKIWQQTYTELQNHFKSDIKFIRNLDKTILANSSDCFVVMDDCMLDLDETVISNFTTRSHHKNVINLIMIQSLYYDNILKHIRRSTNYFIFLNIMESASIFRYISNDITGKELVLFKKAFKAILSENWGHLIYDRHPQTKSILRFKFNIFKFLKNDGVIQYDVVKIL